jgi:hypothetical protein
LTRSAESAGASVGVSLCEAQILPTQLWTDPPFKIKYDKAAGTIEVVQGKAKKYNYAPSVSGNRIFWCVGLNNDVLVSADLNGPAIQDLKPGNMYYLPDLVTGVGPKVRTKYLSCDPFALKTATGFDVYFSRGIQNTGVGGFGAFNAVLMVKAADNGVFVRSSVKTVVPQCGDGVDYGCGQPSIAPMADGTLTMVYRAMPDPAGSGNWEKFSEVSNGAVTGSVTFVGSCSSTEDGASPELFTVAGKNLVFKMQGFGPSGITGIRSYQFVPKSGTTPATLTRDCNLETDKGGGKLARVFNTDGSDGQVGVVRNNTNQAVVTNGNVTYWSSVGPPRLPSVIQRFEMPIPG